MQKQGAESIQEQLLMKKRRQQENARAAEQRAQQSIIDRVELPAGFLQESDPKVFHSRILAEMQKNNRALAELEGMQNVSRKQNEGVCEVSKERQQSARQDPVIQALQKSLEEKQRDYRMKQSAQRDQIVEVDKYKRQQLDQRVARGQRVLDMYQKAAELKMCHPQLAQLEKLNAQHVNLKRQIQQ